MRKQTATSGSYAAYLAMVRSLARWYGGFLLVCALLLLLAVLGMWVFTAQSLASSVAAVGQVLDFQLLLYMVVGFVAQLIDGSLGMAYGISSTSFLMSTGVPPAIASANVHLAEVFTTAVSGLSHWRMGNVDRKLFFKLAMPGALGAGLGAFVLSNFDGAVIKPFVAIYLLVMGLIVICKAYKKNIQFKEYKRPRLLALIGGFVDASGGGGWGPIVTTTLIGSGNNPKLTIGTVNAVEFLVALTASGIFTLSIGIGSWQIIVGLIVGGALAAPVGALVCHYIRVRPAMILVGTLIIFLSLRTLLLMWWG